MQGSTGQIERIAGPTVRRQALGARVHECVPSDRAKEQRVVRGPMGRDAHGADGLMLVRSWL